MIKIPMVRERNGVPALAKGDADHDRLHDPPVDHAESDPPPADGHSSDYPPAAVVVAPEEYVYDADVPADVKFAALARKLRGFGDLYRDPGPRGGLRLVVIGARPQQLLVATPADLLAVVMDRLRITVVEGGKPKGGRIPTAELAAMIRTEVFLGEFRPLDRLITRPMYLPDWSETPPGYTDGGRTQRFYFAGRPAPAAVGLKAVQRFLDHMPFATPADRTNAVAMALTVLLRNHWAGQKPWFLVGGNKSHCGKGTVASFACGHAEPVVAMYETTDWAFQKTIVSLFNARPDLPVLLVDNIRVDGREGPVRSAFLEALLHDPEPTLYAPGAGKPTTVPAHFAVIATANRATFSEDLINRGVTIQLELRGDPAARSSPIGDPKHEYLPAHRDQIEAELRGMIAKWQEAGRPLDRAVRHPFTDWAQKVGGILAVNGFEGFLANRVERRTSDDPVRRALALLGAEYPGDWAAATEWAARAARLGLTEPLVPKADRGTPDGRARGMGVTMSNHRDEPLTAETETERVTVVIRKARRRWDGLEPQVRYRVEELSRQPLPEDADVPSSP